MIADFNKAKPEDVGCWIAGHWGQYGVARMVALAGELGRPVDDLNIFADEQLRGGELIKKKQQPWRSSSMSTKYPEITVKLVGTDGNALALLGVMRKALQQGGVSGAEIKEFMDEALSGDYNHLLSTCCKWANVT